MQVLPRICHTAVRDWSDCRECILWRTRRRVALRRDSGTRARIHILIIGEAPGETEDVTGIPFTGSSGRILDQTLKRVKFPFSYTITNMVNCRPMSVIMMDSADQDTFMRGGFDLNELEYGKDYEIIDKNREPTPQEMESCSSHIKELIDETKPVGIVYLGQVAKKYKTKLPTLSLLHPAFISRMELKLLTVKKQARKLEKFLEKLGGIE